MFKLIFMVVLGLVVMGRSFAVEMDVSSMVQRADEQFYLKKRQRKSFLWCSFIMMASWKKPISMMSMCVKIANR